MLKILLLYSLLTTYSGEMGPPLPNITPLQELVERRAFILQTKLEPLDSQQIALSAINAGYITKLDPLLIIAIIEIESRYDKRAKSSVGFKGLTQVSKIVANHIAERLKMVRYNLFDIDNNILFGSIFMADLIRQYSKLLKALTIYNKGIGNYLKNPGISNYAKAVYGRYRYLKKIYREPLYCAK